MNEINNAQGDGAAESDGSGTQEQQGRPDGLPSNVVERTYFDRVVNDERAKLKRQRDEYEAKIADYEQRLAPKPKAEPQGQPDPLAKVQELEQRLNAQDAKARKQRLVDDVLARVPEGNRAAASDALDAMLYRGEIDINADQAAERAVSTLSQRRAQLFVDPSQKGPRPAPQRRPDGSVDWSRYDRPDQIPRDLVGQVPPAEWARIRGGATGSSAPNI